MTRSQRQRVLALTPRERLEPCWAELGIAPPHRRVRGPEVGMAMVRGRMGATGNAFNLGEMTMTRASVTLDNGALGHGWVRGRDLQHAELIALIDACAQQEALRERIDSELIAPLADELAARNAEASRTAAATRVDFFTMVRGE
ncbi:alpha-D-ribose 1-methylphosphonate 5-triphosphate synthase subunit PhnG [Modicisalibacter xianhensis]|uniref:Alpha-D-ribose 1-methylphosphonate 5-triphosphate synthase subunit PhnG n=1 Tax=Modicisalibacter xianhensis TaxID=442341 RepID=A0A4V3GSZ5_9GAMM|nr:phosphonate C-P lyase system protein PhnG [Halomonas xianhensis]TDX24773.1 alpha-D-ribose 1-methylphosphonate 5-triphosphate synthase subunit PhnG [Halomonas xianhensis]